MSTSLKKHRYLNYNPGFLITVVNIKKSLKTRTKKVLSPPPIKINGISINGVAIS